MPGTVLNISHTLTYFISSGGRHEIFAQSVNRDLLGPYHSNLTTRGRMW